MPKYLLHGNYLEEGAKGLLKEGGSGRRKAIKKLVESLGGKVESLYYAFGLTDIYGIVDFPDHASALAFAMNANASGAVTVTTTVLITTDEVDEAIKKSPNYRPPGA